MNDQYFVFLIENTLKAYMCEIQEGRFYCQQPSGCGGVEATEVTASRDAAEASLAFAGMARDAGRRRPPCTAPLSQGTWLS